MNLRAVAKLPGDILEVVFSGRIHQRRVIYLDRFGAIDQTADLAFAQ
ncbi:MAG: hypothetical protein ACXWXL_03370 [Candidatus Binatia bacterium]